MGRSVGDIMTHNVITILPDASLNDAYALLRGKKISMLVVAQANRAVGLLTERDAVRFIHDNLDIDHSSVASVMTAPVTTVQTGLSLFEAYSILTKKHFRHLVVVDEHDLLAGVVTLTDMLDGMGLEYFVDLKQVATIMTKNLTRVRPVDSLRLVIDLMHRHRISCVIVAEQWKPVGIITERDIVKYYGQGMQVDHVHVSTVMSSPVRTMIDTSYIPEANKVMRDERLRHMVIVDDRGCLTGLISQTDLTSCMEVGYIAYLKNVIEQRESELSQVSHEHHAILRQNPNAVIAFDPTGQITHSNQAALQLAGYDAETLTRQHFLDLIHAGDASRVQGLIQQLCKGQPAHAEFQILRLSGQALDVFTSFLPATTAGKVSCIYAVMHDITEKKQAERRIYQSEQRFHALVELSHAMPWSLDLTTGCFSFVGKQIEQHLGYPVESWVNMATWAARIHAQDRGKALSLCAEATNCGGEHQFACRMLAADGSYVPVQTHISVLMQAGRAIELRGFMVTINSPQADQHNAT